MKMYRDHQFNARTWKTDCIWAVFAGFCTLLIARCLVGCPGNESVLIGGQYSDNLAECNRTAKDMCESIACENHFRRAAGRFPRDTPVHCLIKDAAGD